MDLSSLLPIANDNMTEIFWSISPIISPPPFLFSHCMTENLTSEETENTNREEYRVNEESKNGSYKSH